MCFYTQSSIAAFIFSDAIAIYLIKRNRNYDRYNALFIMVFSLVQLIEAKLWLSLDKQTLNSFLT